MPFSSANFTAFERMPDMAWKDLIMEGTDCWDREVMLAKVDVIYSRHWDLATVKSGEVVVLIR